MKGLCLALVSLTAVAQAQTVVTTSYEYDSVGNRISATNLFRLTDTRVLSFSPSVALHGERVVIFGRNLPPGDGIEITVTFDGIVANIISVSTRVITVEVPQGAMTGPLVVTLPDSPPVDLGTFNIQGIVISPREAVVSFSQMIQFTAEVVGAGAGTVMWELMPVAGADPDASLGSITPDGVYTPPDISDMTAAGELIVRVTSDALNGVVAFARIRLFGTVVDPSRILVILPGPGEDGGLQPSVTVAMPQTSVILPGPGEDGGLQLNVTVGGPPLAVILPGPGGADGLSPNVTVALPPLSVVLPGQGDNGGLQPNTTVAKPRVSVEFEDKP